MAAIVEYVIVEKGGRGSGFHGHAGRPGMVGGSSKRSFDAEIDAMYEESAAKAKKVPAGHLESGLEVPGDWSAQEALFYQAVRDHVVKVHKSGRLDIDYRVLSGLLVRHRPGSAEKTMRGLTMAIAERMIEAGALVKLPEMVSIKDMELKCAGMSISSYGDTVALMKQGAHGEELVKRTPREIMYDERTIRRNLDMIDIVYGERDEEGMVYVAGDMVQLSIHELMHEMIPLATERWINDEFYSKGYVEGLTELATEAMLGNIDDNVVIGPYTDGRMSALVMVGRRLSERGLPLTPQNIVREVWALHGLPTNEMRVAVEEFGRIRVGVAGTVGTPEDAAEYHKYREKAKRYDDFQTLKRYRRSIEKQGQEREESDGAPRRGIVAIERGWEEIPLWYGDIVTLHVLRIRFGDGHKIVMYDGLKHDVDKTLDTIHRFAPDEWRKLEKRQRRSRAILRLKRNQMQERGEGEDTALLRSWIQRNAVWPDFHVRRRRRRRKRSLDGKINAMYAESAGKAALPWGQLETGLKVEGGMREQEEAFYQAVRNHAVKVHKNGRLDIDYHVLGGLLVRCVPEGAPDERALEMVANGLTMAIAERLVEAGALVRLPVRTGMVRSGRRAAVTVDENYVQLSELIAEGVSGEQLIKSLRRYMVYDAERMGRMVRSIREAYRKRDDEGIILHTGELASSLIHELMHEASGLLHAKKITHDHSNPEYMEGLTELATTAMLGNIDDNAPVGRHLESRRKALVLVGRRLSERGLALTPRNIMQEARRLQMLPLGELREVEKEYAEIDVGVVGSAKDVAEYRKFREKAKRYDDFQALKRYRKQVGERGIQSFADLGSWSGVVGVEAGWEQIPLGGDRVAMLHVTRLLFGDGKECAVYDEPRGHVEKVLDEIRRLSPQEWSRVQGEIKRARGLMWQKTVSVRSEDADEAVMLERWRQRLRWLG